MGADDASLFCAAEQYNKYDENRQTSGHALSFLATKAKGELLIEASAFCNNEDIDRLLKNDVFDAVYTDIEPDLLTGTSPVVRVTPVLTKAIAFAEELNKKKSSFRDICISQYQNIYGYYIIRKDADIK